MKKIYSILLTILINTTIWAQSPEKLSYQAVIRNENNKLITSHAVGMRISILQGSTSGAAVYVETQTSTTNANGLVTIEIGTGTTTDDFSGIDWANGTYFIKTETDPTGGENYTITGTSQLLSVPYALHSKTAESISGGINETDPVFSSSVAAGITGAEVTNWNTAYSWGNHAGLYRPISYVPSWDEITGKPTGNNIGDMRYWNGTDWVILPTGQQGQVLKLNSQKVPVWTGTTANINTTQVSSISGTYATSGGSITFDGGYPVTERGVCWSTTTNPTTSDSKTMDGTGTGSFTSSITGLSLGTKYYVRAYAVNEQGTSYGNEVSFTTNSLPTLTTTGVSAITNTTAKTGGEITSDGGSAVTSRGVCWSTSNNPTIEDNKTTDGNDIGSFTSSLSGLTKGTTYYVRAYATNNIGTAYGNEISFVTTDIVPPTLTTASATSITSSSATSGGNITNDGNAEITARGVCWSTSNNPTTGNNHTTDGDGTGAFTSSITGLTANTTYYVRAYAVNSAGTSYGDEISFTTTASVPTLTTLPITVDGTAVGGGNITNDGNAEVIARGVCWSTSHNPTIANNKTDDGSGTGEYLSSITGLTLGTIYYVRAYATNSGGTAYGDEVSFTALEIGQDYQGGKIAYILRQEDPGFDPQKTHGLIVPLEDQSTGIQWYNGEYTNTGATDYAIGTGADNTNKIIKSQGIGNYAAKTCFDFTNDGYSDWYLPSRYELYKIYLSKDAIGGFLDDYYWTSTERNSIEAYYIHFSNGSFSDRDKNNTYRVRAVRSF